VLLFLTACAGSSADPVSPVAQSEPSSTSVQATALPTDTPTTAPTLTPTSVPTATPEPTVAIDPTIELAESYTSQNDLMHVRYPEGWSIDGIANTTLPFPRAFRLYRGAGREYSGVPGEVYLTITDPAGLIERFGVETTREMDLTEALDRLVGDLPDDVDVAFETPLEGRFPNGQAFISQGFSSEALDMHVFLIRTSDDYLVELTGLIAPGERAEIEPTIRAIASTLEYRLTVDGDEPDSPAHAARTYLSLMGNFEDEQAQALRCPRDQVGQMFGEMLLDESTFPALAQEYLQFSRDYAAENYEFDYSTLFYSTIYEQGDEALVSVTGNFRVSAGSEEGMIPYKVTAPLGEAVPMYRSNGEWTVCLAQAMTGFAELENLSGATTSTDEPKIYWINTIDEGIQRAGLNGSNVETLFEFPQSGEPDELALDSQTDTLYWLETDELWRAPLDGSTEPELLLCGRTSGNCATQHAHRWIKGPDGLAIDPTAGKVYFSIHDTIAQSNLDGSDPQEVFSSADQRSISNLAIDSEQSLIYWITHGLGDEIGGGLITRVHRANLDGTEQTVIGETAPGPLFSKLTVDTTNDVVYVSSTESGTIVRIDAASGEVNLIETDAEQVSAVAINPDTQQIFWSDGSRILSMPDMGGEARELVRVRSSTFGMGSEITGLLLDLSPDEEEELEQ
jgi:sugar lactone lactonase YvrE